MLEMQPKTGVSKKKVLLLNQIITFRIYIIIFLMQQIKSWCVAVPPFFAASAMYPAQMTACFDYRGKQWNCIIIDN